MKAKLTKKNIEHLKPKARQYSIHDTELPGLLVWVYSSGRKAYAVYYRTQKGKRRTMALGSAAAMPPTEARKAARNILARVARGEDPLEEKREARRRGMKLTELWEAFETGYLDHPHPAGRKGHRPLAESTRRSYRWYWTKYLRPAFGDLRLDMIVQDDAERLHRKLGRTSATNANRTLALLGSMFSFAEHAHILPRGSNPTHGLVRFEERRRERFLSTEELARLGKALREAEAREPWQAVAAIRLLLFTGARKTEALSMRWEDLDIEHGIWNLPDSKTGARSVFLNAPALALLSGLPRLAGNPWVLPSDRRPTHHFKGLPHAWERIRATAGLEGVRLHDLRHSVASVGRAAGLPLGILQGLLGHREARTTERYAHIGRDPLHEAAETIGRRIQDALGEGGAGLSGNDGAQVVPLHGGSRGDR